MLRLSKYITASRACQGPRPFAARSEDEGPTRRRAPERYTGGMEKWAYLAFAFSLGTFAFAFYLMKGAGPSRPSW